MKAVRAHKHTLGHEHDHEPQRGLPEPLPADEHIVWQGSPDWRSLARHAFHLRKLAAYFAALLALRAAFAYGDGGALVALKAVAVALPLALLSLAGLALVAWLTARHAVYTVTDRRVVMRIGIVLTLTFNLPFKRIASAGLRRYADGSGDIPLALMPGDRIAWLHLWPHARPFRLSRPEPMLRSLPQAEQVAQLLTQAWSGATGGSAAPAEAPRVVRRPAAASLATH